jgi:deazaflavin-dependent oxidoreductase (nitroreductase family)
MPDLGPVVDDDFCYLTTRGRVTGGPHEIEIWFAAFDQTLYLLSGGGFDADWVRNLQADPVVTVRLGDRSYPAAARILGRGAESERARSLVFEKYQPRYRGDLSGWRERSVPVAVDLDQS